MDQNFNDLKAQGLAILAPLVAVSPRHSPSTDWSARYSLTGLTFQTVKQWQDFYVSSVV